MKLKIEGQTDGAQLLENLIKEIADVQGIKVEPANFKFFVSSKEGKQVEIGPERLTIIFSK